MTFVRTLRLALLPIALGLTTLAAHADTFDWSITGPAASLGGFSETGTGTLTATDVAGTWTVNSIDGTLNGSAVTGLIAVNGFEGNDNKLFPSTTFLDTDGLSFETATVKINIFSFYAPNSTGINPANNNYGEYSTVGSFGVGTFSLTDTTSPVPEPSSLALLATGLISAAGVLRKRLS